MLILNIMFKDIMIKDIIEKDQTINEAILRLINIGK